MTVDISPDSINPTSPKLVILAGPTAVGKTELSLALAEKLRAEIISADSRQIYRELTIGTAKPTPAQLARVPHHFIDELNLGQPYSAGRFQSGAEARMKEIESRGRTSLVVGGSTLYLHAVRHGLDDIPDVNTKVRASIQQRLEAEGAEKLFGELQRIDPEAAARLDATKTQRLVRALEVFEGTGRPLSHYHGKKGRPRRDALMFVLHRERRELYRRIDLRVDEMMHAGLLQEVEALLSRSFDPKLNPLRTIGYQEPIAYLGGEISYDEMVERIKRNSRRYAKRQLTWFRHDGSNIWLEADRPFDLIVAEIVRTLEDLSPSANR